MKYDAFLSYASEDAPYASGLVNALASDGFRIWYAPVSLEPGTKLLQSIEQGMIDSTYGILLLSCSYIAKPWPKFEYDTLMRRHIEQEEKIIPIWLNITKDQIESFSPALSGIVALLATDTGDQVPGRVKKIISMNAPTIGIIPIYEDPVHRFLSGRSEIVVGNHSGGAASIWELVLSLEESQYPIFIYGELYTMEDILSHAARTISSIPDVVEDYVGAEGRQRIIEILRAHGTYFAE
jgi:hypothetical protein